MELEIKLDEIKLYRQANILLHFCKTLKNAV